MTVTMRKYSILFIICLLFAARLKAQAVTNEAIVKISGEMTSPFELTLQGLQNFKQVQVTRKDKDGKDHTYTGVELSAILQKAGVTIGNNLRGKNLTKYALVGAIDGYQVVFALAELDQDFTDRKIIITDTADGKPLTPAEGPFRVIVQDEKKPARCVKQVISIKIISAE